MKIRLLCALLLLAATAHSQTLQVTYDKSHDFSSYRTFSFGAGEIVTPRDQKQIEDKQKHDWIRTAVANELQAKGLQRVDSAGDLIVSYMVTSVERTQIKDLGPMGGTPGADPGRTWSRDFRQGSYVIDLHSRKGPRVWRINATTNTGGADSERTIIQLVGEGFRKLSTKPPRKKRKK